MSNVNERLSRRRILFGGLLLLAILLVFCLWWHGRQIPADITRHAGQALAAAGFDSGFVQAVDGRVVILSGEIDADDSRQRMVETVQSARGVRRVIDNLVVIQSDSPSSNADQMDNRVQASVSQRPARLHFRISEDKALIQGELPDRQTADQLIAAARPIYGHQNVTDAIIISEEITPPDWLSGVQQLLAELEALGAAEITIADDRLTLSGVVTSDTERTAIEKRAAALFGQLQLSNQIRVKTPSAVKPASGVDIQLPTLYFKHARSDLTADSAPLLADIIDTLKRRPDLRVEIAAHTDSSGEEVLNTDLSERRAQAIVQALVSGGIDSNRLAPQAYSESRPVAENTTTEGRARNRRVEFRIIE
jgi:OOP family OmpA-OmpF porin